VSAQLRSVFVNLNAVLFSGGADFTFIPEKPPTTMPWEDAMCAEIHRVRFHIMINRELILIFV